MNLCNIRDELEFLKDDVWTAADGCANCQFESYEDMLCDCDFEACAYQMTRVICARLDKIIKLTEEVEDGSQDHSHDA